MILYTIYDPSVVFQNVDYYNQEKLNSGFAEMEVNGVRVLAAPAQNEGMRIERLLSTNPMHFLDPRLQPGVSIPEKRSLGG